VVDDRGFAIEYETRDRAIEAVKGAMNVPPAKPAEIAARAVQKAKRMAARARKVKHAAELPLHDRLARAALAYDKRCAKRERISNPYRIGHILGGVERAEQAIAKGATVRTALCACFNDRLLDAMLKAAGEAPATVAECRGRVAV
jgi:hypothetical protein